MPPSHPKHLARPDPPAHQHKQGRLARRAEPAASTARSTGVHRRAIASPRPQHGAGAVLGLLESAEDAHAVLRLPNLSEGHSGIADDGRRRHRNCGHLHAIGLTKPLRLLVHIPCRRVRFAALEPRSWRLAAPRKALVLEEGIVGPLVRGGCPRSREVDRVGIALAEGCEGGAVTRAHRGQRHAYAPRESSARRVEPGRVSSRSVGSSSD